MRAFISALLVASAFADGEIAKAVGGYDYRAGGEDWGTIYGDNDTITGYHYEIADNICGQATSLAQSPINLVTDEATNDVNEVFETYIKDHDMQFSMTGFESQTKAARDKATTNMEVNWELVFTHSEEADVEFMRTDAMDVETPYKPVQMHWHTLSEHTIDGAHMDAELHIVTQHADGEYAVLGVFFDMGTDATENAWVKTFLEAYGDRFNADESAKKQVDVLELTDSLDGRSAWMYDGSFTTPPCTEGVKWTVSKEVQSISQAQLDTLRQFTAGEAAGNELNAIESKYLTYV